MLIHSAVITGSVQLNNTDVSGITNVSGFATTASVDVLVVKTGSYASTSSLNELQAKTGSYATTSSVDNLQSVTGSYATTSSFGAYTSSNDSTNTTQNTRLSTIESVTGSYATTGSNTFIGTNVFTGSVFITSDLVVQGSSSLQNITASAVSIGTNTVILNTNTPILQFGGISVQDSGSTAGRSGSLLWNSVNDHWINVNPSGSDEGYNSAMVINGPKNTGSLGQEVGLTTNYIPVSQGEDHITDSIIFQSGSTNIGIGTTTPTRLLDVSAAGTAYIRASDRTNSVNVDMLAASSGGWIGTQSSHAFILQTANTERMRITSTGNVGIGTTSPDALLTVAGTNQSLGGAFNTYGNALIYSTDSYAINKGGSLSFGGKYNASGTPIETFARIHGKKESATDGATSGYLSFETTNDATALLTERIRITSTGNVGIGTSSPGYKLHVDGNGYFSGALSSGGGISAAGTLSSAALSTSQVLYAANLTTFNYAGTLALTVPNALNSGSTLAEIRMYMIWATGFGDASHGGGRIWLMIMNGGGTAYSAVELLGRDTDGGSGLSISRSAVNQITISSNGYGFIKSVSCMQLITN
jgi:hypothetical protein